MIERTEASSAASSGLPLEGRDDPPTYGSRMSRWRRAPTRRARRRRPARPSAASTWRSDPRLGDGRRRRRPDGRRAGAPGRPGVLNLEGVQPATTTRMRSSPASPRRPTARSRTSRRGLPAADPRRPRCARLAAIHARLQGGRRATPGAARRFGPFCAEHGADLFLVQSQVCSARHLATDYDPLSLGEFTRYMPIRSRSATRPTPRRPSAHGAGRRGGLRRRRARRRVHHPRGPRHRRPAVTAISDVAAARDAYERETGRYVPSSPMAACAAGASWPGDRRGADALMIGSPLAKAEEAPGEARTGAWPPRRRCCREGPASGRDDWLLERILTARRRHRRLRGLSARCASPWPPSAPGPSARWRGSRWSTPRRC